MNPTPNRWNLPDLGLGVGLRTVHYNHILSHHPPVDWFEAITDNYIYTQGRPLHILRQVAERYPVVLHGVSMSVGSTDPLDMGYLAQVKQLAELVNARWVGDHICWTGVSGRNTHDLLPIPLNEQTLAHVAARVRVIQDFLERPLVLENASTYMTFADSTMPEPRFIARLAEEADCALLLDVNNVYVTCRNHGWDPMDYLRDIPYDRVVQIHLAGHTDKQTHCLDTHDGPVIEKVWALYAHVHQRTGGRATLLEWDDHIPEFQAVHGEVLRARKYRDSAHVLESAGAE